MSDETRAKLSAIKLGVPGKKLSTEAKERLSVARVGDKNPFYGRQHSQEAKAKMSKIHKGRRNSPEHKAKLLAANLGRKYSPESREKMRQAALARCARKKLLDAANATYGGGE